ncbi:hypothetical protein HDU97_001784 [Phlyctochytrium planicorne]|nr:hypothetical protein HDU97_001784 [Phlyctochytrium planicorne]
MSSWLNSIANSEGVSWMVKAVSEVESRIDRALDIQAPPSKPEGSGGEPNENDSTADPNSQPPSQYASAAGSLSNLNSKDATAVVSQSLSSGLSSLRNLSTSITSSIQAAATSATISSPSNTNPNATNADADFFSSMLGGFAGTRSPPSTRKSQVADGKPIVSVKPDLLSSILMPTAIAAPAVSPQSEKEIITKSPAPLKEEKPRKSLSERLNSVSGTPPASGNLPRKSFADGDNQVLMPNMKPLDEQPAPSTITTQAGKDEDEASVKTSDDAAVHKVLIAADDNKIQAEAHITDAKDTLLPSKDLLPSDSNDTLPSTVIDTKASVEPSVVKMKENLIPEPIVNGSPAVLIKTDETSALIPEPQCDAPQGVSEDEKVEEDEKDVLSKEPSVPFNPDPSILKGEKVSPEKIPEVVEVEANVTADSLIALAHPSIGAVKKLNEYQSTPEETKLPAAIEQADHLRALGTDLSRMKEVIEERERQLMNAMTANATLTETSNILRAQLEQLEAVKTEENSRLESVVQEFTARLGKSEGQVKDLAKERDNLKQQLTAAQGSLQGNVAALMKQIADKDEKIRDLLAEGEKLSKSEFKTSNILKKLRAKEADTDRELKELTRKLETSAFEIADLKEKVSKLTESEKRLNESLRSVNELNDKQAKLIVQLENQLAHAKDDVAQMNTLVERSRLELQEARKLQAEAATAAQSSALERELKTNEEIHKQLEDLQRTSMNVENALRKEVFDLRSALSRIEDEASWREENLRKETQSLQMRLLEAESRFEDLDSETRTADRTLIRQIELLQSQHSQARRDWEHIEFSLTTRLQEAESERAAFTEKERQLNQKISDLTAKTVGLELQASQERHESARLTATLESEKTRAELMERNVAELSAKIDILKANHIRAMEEAKEKFKESLKTKIEEEKKQWDQLRRVEEQTRQSDSVSSRSKPSDLAPVSSATSSRMPSFADTPPSPRSPALSGVVSPQSSTFSGAPAVVVDRLHAAVKHYQGQVATLQSQLQMITKTRDELAEELLKSSTEAYEGKDAKAKITELEKEKGDINKKFMTALELLGEKTEQYEELKVDMQEMKASYQTQLEELLKQIEQLKK